MRKIRRKENDRNDEKCTTKLKKKAAENVLKG